MNLEFNLPLFLSILSIIITAYVTLVVNRVNRKVTYVNTVTSEMVKWIGKVREDVSEFSGLSYHWVLTSLDSLKEQELLEKIDILRIRIKLQLDPTFDDDNKIIKLIDKIPTLTGAHTTDELKKAIIELTETTQHLLKNE